MVNDKRQAIIDETRSVTNLMIKVSKQKKEINDTCKYIIDSFYDIFVGELCDTEFFYSSIKNYDYSRRGTLDFISIHDNFIWFNYYNESQYCIGQVKMPIEWLEENALQNALDKWANDRKSELKSQIANCKKILSKKLLNL